MAYGSRRDAPLPASAQPATRCPAYCDGSGAGGLRSPPNGGTTRAIPRTCRRRIPAAGGVRRRLGQDADAGTKGQVILQISPICIQRVWSTPEIGLDHKPGSCGWQRSGQRIAVPRDIRHTCLRIMVWKTTARGTICDSAPDIPRNLYRSGVLPALPYARA